MNNQQNNQDKNANQQNVNKTPQSDFQQGGQNKSSSQQPHDKQYDRQDSSKTTQR